MSTGSGGGGGGGEGMVGQNMKSSRPATTLFHDRTE